MRIWDIDLGEVRQSDGFTCGPTSAMIAAALLDPAYASALDTTAAGFAREQRRIHRASNRLWPRRLGTTPWGVAAAISIHSAALGVRYGWRMFRGPRDDLTDVLAALDCGWPVALLIGRVIPRHWLLCTEHPDPATLRVYNPASGRIRDVGLDELRHHRLRLGFPRAFALVLPNRIVSG
ncbi:MAG TPA: hypothetical protein VF755_00315 [Catenuloplanes sp.]|jgi:hypothetical protein